MPGRILGVQRPMSAARFLFSALLVILLAACTAPTPPTALVADAIRVENPMARPAAG